MASIACRPRAVLWVRGLSPALLIFTLAFGATLDRGWGMIESDDEKRDEVLKRLLETPPQPKSGSDDKKDDDQGRRPFRSDQKKDEDR